MSESPYANRAEAVSAAIESGSWVTVPCSHAGDTIRLLTTELVRRGCVDFRFRIDSKDWDLSVSFLVLKSRG